MDLFDFQLIRKSRNNGFNAAWHATFDLPSTPTGTALVGNAATLKRLQDRLLDWVTKSPSSHLLTGGFTPSSNPSTVESALIAIGEADIWLLSVSDMPNGLEFINFRKDLIDKTPALKGQEQGLVEARDVIWRSICSFVREVIVHRDQLPVLAYCCRWLLIADLLDTVFLTDAELAADKTGRLVWDRIHRREVVLPSDLSDLLAELARQHRLVRLVRDATVADLFVVRSEWSCYLYGEIASITNTLANSKFEFEQTITNEEETVTTTETETIQSTEQSEEDRTQTELSREVERSVSRQVDVSGSVNVSGQYGTTSFGATASAGYSSSLEENVRQASKIAHDLVSKAISKVESRVREVRVQRLLKKTVDRTLHAINNEGKPNANAVYRWVDRIDRYQVFRFPNRLQLEFQIPEPAEYLRWRRTEGKEADPIDVSPPPPFTIQADQITRDNYTQFALTYRATNLPPPPDEEIALTEVLTSQQDDDGGADYDEKEVWDCPVSKTVKNIMLPAGYLATNVSFSGIAMPLRRKWRIEATDPSTVPKMLWVEGFHQISLTVVTGYNAKTFTQAGPEMSDFTVQLKRGPEPNNPFDDQRSAVMFRGASLPVTIQTFSLDPSVRDILNIGFLAAGAASTEVSFLVTCRLGDNAMAEWQNTVYDALLDAWQSWGQAYRTAQLQKRASSGPCGWDITSPSRNKEIIRDELKRQVIAWLLDEQSFAGRNAMIRRDSNWDPINLEEAQTVAPEIQFFEQAFEWGNLTYVCYPYYWAREEQWNHLADIEAADPNLAQFLRAGSVRVVVPTRPGMEDAVKYYLIYGQPNLSGPLPIPGDPEYLSIAQEVRDLTAPISGGEPGPCWESRMGTPLLWLDAGTHLPSNEEKLLGKPPHCPDEPLCPHDN